MLVCKVAKETICTFEHDDSKLRKWSGKGLLKCPDCEGSMIYRNGDFKIAHFAHEESCSEKEKIFYHQPESEEHMLGKKALYKWLKNQGVDNLKLEAWIPETKQRPDIYFEFNNKRYVVEYQCHPIATKYVERHELYRLAGVNDIWILGKDKYDIVKNESMFDSRRTKTIERQIMEEDNHPLMYFYDNQLYFASTKKRKKITKVVKYINPYKSFDLCKCYFGDIINMDSYEHKTYSVESNKIREMVKIISKTIRSKYNIDNINTVENKIYTFYGNTKKMIHVCWDERELEFDNVDYDYIPVILSQEYNDFSHIGALYHMDYDIRNCNYLVDGKFYCHDSRRNEYMESIDFDFKYFTVHTGENKHKAYEIRIIDKFYNNGNRSIFGVETDWLGSTAIKDIERNLSGKLRKRVNYLCFKSKEKKRRLLPDYMERAKKLLMDEGYTNVKIYWG